MDKAQIIKLIVDDYPECQAIYIFGSKANATDTPHSDVDIAVLLPGSTYQSHKDMSYSDLKFRLEKKLALDVDLVNLREVKTVFQKEIIFNSVLIYEQDPQAVQQFEMITLSLYQLLQDERKEILEQFHKTGRAYQL